MIKEAIEKILELAEVELITADNGVEYATKPLHIVLRPEPRLLTIHSLQGLIDYIDFEKINSVTVVEYALFVEDTDKVVLRSMLIGNTEQREAHIEARNGSLTHHFERFLPVEQFIIWLKSLFADSPDRETVIKLVGNIVAGAEIQVEDDGFTQRVTAKAGIVRREEVSCPNPVFLRPFLTFPEVEQPLSPFILRTQAAKDASGKDEPVKVALFPADGGYWQVQARANIAAWLREKQTTVPVIA